MISNLIKMLFKQKGVELTPDDMQVLSELEEKTGVKVDTNNIPADISHNLKVINEYKQAFEAQIEELRKERDAYKAEITELTKIIGEERAAREASLKAIQERQAKEQSEKIENLIKTAIESKRIPPQNTQVIEKLKAIAATDFDAAKAVIDAINPIVESSQATNNNQNSVPTKPASTIHTGIASGADPKILAFVEQQFAALDSNKN